MLLDAYPGSLHERTRDGKSLLDLAESSATRSHPNFALIETLKAKFADAVPHSNPSMYVTPCSIASWNGLDTHHFVTATDAPPEERDVVDTDHRNCDMENRKRKRTSTPSEQSVNAQDRVLGNLLLHFHSQSRSEADMPRSY
jgi:hypothetical protein